MNKDELMIEEFKQAGSEYTFFQDLALKYLKFYSAAIGIVTTAFLGISYHFAIKENHILSPITITSSTQQFDSIAINTPKITQPTSDIVTFLKDPFLVICGWSIIIIGIITAFTLIKCRTKCIDSIKSMMRIREFFYDTNEINSIKKYSYYANIAPRYYQIRSTTQGILIIIAFINAISYLALSNGGINKVFSANSIFLLDLLPMMGLAFIQYMIIFKYLMRKDVVKVELKFIPEQHIKKIRICYNVPRSLTNNSISHRISRFLYWLIGLPERENILFLRRGKTHCREIPIENNQKSLELIAGYYQIVAQGHNGKDIYYKVKDLLVFSNIYREFKNGEEIKLESGNEKDFSDFKIKELKDRLIGRSKEQRIALYMETKYLVYIGICSLFILKRDFATPFLFSFIATFAVTPKFFIDFWKRSPLCNRILKPKLKRKIRRIKAYIRISRRRSKKLIKKIKES